MADFETTFKPHNDMSPDDISIVERHTEFLNAQRYGEATALLDENSYDKGFRASLFNTIETKLKAIGEYLLNKYVAEPDEYYSYTEPTDTEMEGKTWWIQPY